MDSPNKIVIQQPPIEEQQKANPTRKVVLFLLASLLIAGAVASTTSGSSHASGIIGRKLADGWTAWISEGINTSRGVLATSFSSGRELGRRDGLISGMRCRGSYCDDIQARYELSDVHKGSFRSEIWSKNRDGTQLSEENGGTYICPGIGYIAGLECSGKYCDNLNILCTEYNDRPRNFCRWTDGLFSEEQGEITFPSGFYLAGMKCRGSYCDNKQFYICRDEADKTTFPANPDDCSVVAGTDSAAVTGFRCIPGSDCALGENYRVTCAVPENFGEKADSIVRVTEMGQWGDMFCPNGYLVKSIEENDRKPTLVCAKFNNRQVYNHNDFTENHCIQPFDFSVGGRVTFNTQTSRDFPEGYYLVGIQCNVGRPFERTCEFRDLRGCEIR